MPRLLVLVLTLCAWLASAGEAPPAADVEPPPPPEAAPEPPNLEPLLALITSSDDPAFHLDILKGIGGAITGFDRLPAPPSWKAVQAKLATSALPEVRTRAQALGVLFGDQSAFTALRRVLRDTAAPIDKRQEALNGLVAGKDPGVGADCRALLAEPELRVTALRALAGSDDPATADTILAGYPSWNPGERLEAVTALAGHAVGGRRLAAAMAAGTVPPRDLDAACVRLLHSLKDAEVDAALGRLGLSPKPRDAAAIERELAAFKRRLTGGLLARGDRSYGRMVFMRTCMQCHSLYGEGGTVGPDITGHNRGDLDYLLLNIVDPNALIGADYQVVVVRLRSGRVLTGLVAEESTASITVKTSAGPVTVPRADITAKEVAPTSMMPDGILSQLDDQELGDLFVYLMTKEQAAMPSGPRPAVQPALAPLPEAGSVRGMTSLQVFLGAIFWLVLAAVIGVYVAMARPK